MKKNHTKHLMKSESGSVFIIVAFAILLLLSATGVAVDTSRYIIAKNRATSALDAATLATATVATSAPDLNAVGQNYFDANFGGSSSFLNASMNPVSMTYDPVTFTVTGTATGTVNTTIMGIFGYNNLPINAYAEASFAQTAKMEVVLTLDNSPSMCPPLVGSLGTIRATDPPCGKYRDAVNASKAFIDTLWSTPSITERYVGIVPFSHQVANGVLENPVGLTDDRTVLENSLDNMRTDRTQWTRTNVGADMAWKMLRTEPAYRALFPHKNASLPAAFGSGVNKVVVMMTDGANILSYTPLPPPATAPNNKVVHHAHTFDGGGNDDADMADRCTRMKQDGIIIYSVLFDISAGLPSAQAAGITSSVETLFRNCASSPTVPFYHNIDCGGSYGPSCGANLVAAYESMAQSLSKILLTK